MTSLHAIHEPHDPHFTILIKSHSFSLLYIILNEAILKQLLELQFHSGEIFVSTRHIYSCTNETVSGKHSIFILKLYSHSLEII